MKRDAVRQVTPADEAFLWLMLFHASRSDAEEGVTPDDLKHDPELARYAENWGRPGDLGVVCERSGEPLGAAWLRLPVGTGRLAPGFVADDVPELAIATRPGHEGRGIGTRMLRALIGHAAGRYPAITLNVRLDNPAIALYRRFGFTDFDVLTNRVGTTSVKMLLRPVTARP
ncbi:GNAT family N-acetyltransferase [Saccharothrix saharensis]|uniref:GNAT family N-acetyltransferase n=1 Tax=Saccharothrix saharensis TaxID=571190 RepID=UPI0036BF6042